MKTGDPRFQIVLCLQCGMPLCEICYRCHYCLKGLCPKKWQEHMEELAYYKSVKLATTTSCKEIPAYEFEKPLPENVKLEDIK